MDWIPPELRENRGEIEASLEGKLPKLIELSDIKGDLHNHSNWSDGTPTFEEMAEHAMKMGYKYLVVSDHSKSLHVANGLKDEELLEEIEEIDKLNKIFKGFTLLKATEVDIKVDGSLDFPDKLLEKLDIVVASIHSGFKQGKEKITERMIAASGIRLGSANALGPGRRSVFRNGFEGTPDKVIDVC